MMCHHINTEQRDINNCEKLMSEMNGLVPAEEKMNPSSDGGPADKAAGLQESKSHAPLRARTPLEEQTNGVQLNEYQKKVGNKLNPSVICIL